MSSIVNFGAFVDLGGMDGLVHVSELSWKHVDHPGSVVEVGDEVTVQVLDVDLDRERISLSLKATQQDPWQEFARDPPGRRARLRPGHQARAVRRVRPGRRRHRGPGAHLGDGGPPRRAPRAGRHPGEESVGQDHRHRPRAPPDQPVDQAGRRGHGRRGRGDEFDPTLYGEHAYDEQGNYVYPEGFDAETGEWLEGYDTQREEWEQQYAEARARFEAHRRQVEESRAKADEEKRPRARAPTPARPTEPRAPPAAAARAGPARRAPRVRSPRARPRAPVPPARWLPTRPSRPCGRSCPAARADPEFLQRGMDAAFTPAVDAAFLCLPPVRCVPSRCIPSTRCALPAAGPPLSP